MDKTETAPGQARTSLPAAEPASTAVHQILPCPDGASIAYHRLPGRDGLAGSDERPGVVFLHGLMSDMQGGKAIALEAHCRARGLPFLRFDQTGHGASSGRFVDGTVGRWAEDTVRVLDALTEGPQILVGSSMGGWVMLLAALARPHRVAGLLGIAPAPDFTEDLIWKSFTPDQRATVERDGVVYVPSDYSPEPYAFSRALFEDGRRHLLLRGEIPFAGWVRLLHGQQDTAVPWQRSLTLMERLASRDVACTFIKDGDHRLSEPADIARLCATLDSML